MYLALMDNTKVLIQLNNASFKYSGEEYLFENVKLTVKAGDKTAIVGANGSGKSTLLKLLTGELKLDRGNQEINCSPYYVPQIDLTIPQGNMKIFEYISQYYEEWWDVVSHAEKLFGLAFDVEAETKTLSGGELMKLNLAIALKHSPDVLILDEPTNHLDVASTSKLIDFINTHSNYTYVIVSHDIFFLDQVVNNIWELEHKTITTYGGNYSFYKEQKALHLRGIQKQYELAKEKLERAKQLEQKEIEKNAKKANEAKRAFIKGSIDKRAYNEGKNAASAKERGSSIMLERLIENAEEKLEESETEDRHLAFINIKNTKEHVNKKIFEITKGELKVGNKKLISEFNLTVTYGDRIVLAGDNGSGKTSLIKALINKGTNTVNAPSSENIELSGEVYVGNDLAWVYIDQHYSLIKPDLTLLENLMNYNKLITEDKAKEQLGKFQFKTELEMNKLGSNLSGGEMVRLIMSMITTFPVDLVVLDEPTNNLDVETVEILIKSLNNFRGAVIVISHNIDFLNKIKIKSSYIIRNKKLTLMQVDPSNRDAYYNALLG